MNRRKWYCMAGILVMICMLAFAETPVQAAKLPALKVKGTKLVNSKGKTVQLKGVSTHGLSWYPKYVNQKAESSAPFKSSCNKTSGFTSGNLSPWGKWLLKEFKK